MGLIDRDYMQERREVVPAWLRPRRPRWDREHWLALLAACALIGGLYVGADAYLDHRMRKAAALRLAEAQVAAARAAEQARAEAEARRLLAPSRLFPGAPDVPAAPGSIGGVPPPVGSTRTMLRCTGPGGSTGYVDGACLAGQRATTVVVRNDVNLADGLRVKPEPEPRWTAPARTQSQGVTQDASAVLGHKAECDALDEAIRRYDAAARQPQSGQSQDWISERRKEARDRQFRIRCR